MASPLGSVPVHNEAPEPFPELNGPSSPTQTPIRPTASIEQSRNRQESTTSTLQGRLRSVSKTFQESSPPTGFMVASGQIASSIPTLSQIRRGSYGSEGWSGEGQIVEKQRRESLGRRGSSQTGDSLPGRRSSNNVSRPREVSGQDVFPQTVPEVADESENHNGIPMQSTSMTDDTQKYAVVDQGLEGRGSNDTSMKKSGPLKEVSEYKTTPFDNGYEFPPKHKWTESTAIFLKASWGFFITPIGFLVVVYGLNVVAWGGMLFLLLCNASPAMCRPTCNDINSPRRIWVEIDSQILNALFCVTGFGTIPWRFRDLYYLMQYRLQKKEIGLRRLAGINRGWFRLAGSQELPITLGPGAIDTELPNTPENTIPFPISKIPDAPLTGIRAPPTAIWKLDFVIWTMVWNTFLQAVLCGFMWGYNRYDRPSWSTGFFVACACIVAAAGGIMGFIEGKHVKAIEGVPVTEADQERLRRDRELGITHYNNIKAEKPKEKKEKKGLFRRK
ncbi:uncharacterized protein RAG0_09357 [Rhynchosporium agropyri]|uniref:Alpha-L-rhamnosidase C n=1 Tax=Rhynchosporium agropyri TaxID=914238 RepID=A0A1E1KV78_9HELO|nr:uncharacterized protein RAG0_09357 [Rhynchosporium agropyri]